MEVPVHRNFSIAAYIIFAAATAGLAGFLLNNTKSSGDEISYAVETALLLVVLGYFSLLGKDWLKWVLGFITVLGLLALLPVVENFSIKPLYNTLILLQSALNVAALTALFLAPKGTQ